MQEEAPVLENVPALQTEHVPAALKDHIPAMHIVQVSEPRVENVPATQVEHVLEDMGYDPAPQFVQDEADAEDT